MAPHHIKTLCQYLLLIILKELSMTKYYLYQLSISHGLTGKVLVSITHLYLFMNNGGFMLND